MKNKITEILLNEKATGALIKTINLSNEGVIKLDDKSLSVFEKNLGLVLASMDDLRTSVKDEYKRREPSEEVLLANLYEECFNIKNNNFEPRETSDSCKSHNSYEKSETKDEDKGIDPVISKAVEIARKYKIGIPYLEEGGLFRDIKRGMVVNEDIESYLVNIYDSMLQGGFFGLDEEDYNYMVNFIEESNKSHYSNEKDEDFTSIEMDLNELPDIIKEALKNQSGKGGVIRIPLNVNELPETIKEALKKKIEQSVLKGKNETNPERDNKAPKNSSSKSTQTNPSDILKDLLGLLKETAKNATKESNEEAKREEESTMQIDMNELANITKRIARNYTREKEAKEHKEDSEFMEVLGNFFKTQYNDSDPFNLSDL